MFNQIIHHKIGVRSEVLRNLSALVTLVNVQIVKWVLFEGTQLMFSQENPIWERFFSHQEKDTVLGLKQKHVIDEVSSNSLFKRKSLIPFGSLSFTSVVKKKTVWISLHHTFCASVERTDWWFVHKNRDNIFPFVA